MRTVNDALSAMAYEILLEKRLTTMTKKPAPKTRAVKIDANQLTLLIRVKDFKGIPVTEQVRRALNLWFTSPEILPAFEIFKEDK